MNGWLMWAPYMIVGLLLGGGHAISIEDIDRVIAAGPYSANWTDITTRYAVPSWYVDAKFGFYTHWGVYSVPAFKSEWYPRNMYRAGDPEHTDFESRFGALSVTSGYKEFIPHFRGEFFNATEWMRVFRAAGARYAGPVGEHHDGFAMYNCSISHYNAVEMGPRRDVTGELRAAADAAGLRFVVSSHRAWHSSFYDGGRSLSASDVAACACKGGGKAAADADYCTLYCPANPNEHTPTEGFMLDWLLRTCEIIEKYRNDVLYFDWFIGVAPEWQPWVAKMAAFYYNSMHAVGKEGVINTKGTTMPVGADVLDFERGGACTVQPRPWQTDTSISDKSWGYIEGDTYKSAASVMANLVDIVAKNGNLLMNVGPAPNGSIPAAAVAAFESVGGWLAGGAEEAIFGTRPYHAFGEGPSLFGCGSFAAEEVAFAPSDFRFTTKNNNTVYVIAMGLSAWRGGRLAVVSLGRGVRAYSAGEVSSVTLLGHGPVSFEELNSGLVVTLPPPSCCGPLALAVRGLSDVQWDGVVRQSGDGGFRLDSTTTDQLSGGTKLSTASQKGGGTVTVAVFPSGGTVRWSLRCGAPQAGMFEVSALVSSPDSNVALLLSRHDAPGEQITLAVPQTETNEFVTVRTALPLTVPAGDSFLLVSTNVTASAIHLAKITLVPL